MIVAAALCVWFVLPLLIALVGNQSEQPHATLGRPAQGGHETMTRACNALGPYAGAGRCVLAAGHPGPHEPHATDARAAKPNVYGWMLARHATRTILKVPRLRVRVTIQLWRPWRDDA